MSPNTARRLVIALMLAATAAIPASVVAQDLHPSRRPSPMGMARITLGDTYVRVVYSRPYERGRDNIFGTEESGALVPYGKLWRTGANEATEITVTGDVTMAGEKLPAGTYSLFTTPGPEEWTFHFNSVLGMSGTGFFDEESGTFEEGYSADNDVLTVTVPAGTIEGAAEDEEKKVEQLTISFERTETGADMVLRWITTEVRVPVAVAM